MVRLGGARAHHDHALDPVPRHRGGDVTDAVAVDGDRLSGERHTERRQYDVGSFDSSVDGPRVMRVGLHDVELFMRDREFRRSPGYRGDVLTGGQRLSGQQPAGRPVGAENDDPHGCAPSE